LALAVENEFLGAVVLLLEYGADVNAAAGGGSDKTGSASGEGIGNGKNWEDEMEGEDR
jgi:hypothetical protein